MSKCTEFTLIRLLVLVIYISTASWVLNSVTHVPSRKISCVAGNVFLWDKLAAAMPDAPTRFLEDFVRPKAHLSPAPAAARPAGMARAARAAGKPQRVVAGEAAAAAQLARVQASMAAAVSAIVGAEVLLSAPCCLAWCQYPTFDAQPYAPIMDRYNK